MKGALAAIALAFLVPSAGCGGTASPESSKTSEALTPSSTPENTPATTATTFPTATTTVPPSQVVEFQELTDQQQSAFQEVLKNEARFVPNSSYIDDSEGYEYREIDPFQEHQFVRYEDVLYRIELQTGELYTSYTIQASAGTPGTNETVVVFANISREVQEEVQTAIMDGEYHASLGKWNSRPVSLDGTEYI